jgi:hypothetical protein
VKVPFLLDAHEDAAVEAFLESVELSGEIRYGRTGRRILRHGKGHAPYLSELLAIEVAEELHKARKQIALGEQHIHGKADPQRLMQLLKTLSNFAGMALALAWRLPH